MEPWKRGNGEKDLPSKVDMINNPPHYTQCEFEFIDMVDQLGTKEERIGFHRFTAMQYLWRMRDKGAPGEDAGKAGWHCERLAKVFREMS